MINVMNAICVWFKWTHFGMNSVTVRKLGKMDSVPIARGW